MPKFVYDANKVQELIDAGYSVVLFKDGAGGLTAVAAKGDPLTESKILADAVEEWQANDDNAEFREYNTEKLSEEDKNTLFARSIFQGAAKYSGAGVGPKAVAMALHSLTEKALRERLPDNDNKDAYHTKPKKPTKGKLRKPREQKIESTGCGSE